jgi:hypothetical protein
MRRYYYNIKEPDIHTYLEGIITRMRQHNAGCLCYFSNTCLLKI